MILDDVSCLLHFLIEGCLMDKDISLSRLGAVEFMIELLESDPEEA